MVRLSKGLSERPISLTLCSIPSGVGAAQEVHVQGAHGPGVGECWARGRVGDQCDVSPESIPSGCVGSGLHVYILLKLVQIVLKGDRSPTHVPEVACRITVRPIL